MKDIKKVTPKGDLSWYIKWADTFFIVIGLMFRSNMFLMPYDLVLSFTGTVLWAFVGYLWHDRSLIVLNTVCSTILMFGIIRYFAVLQIYKTLYAPPLQGGDMSCKNFISICTNQLSKVCKNNTTWDLALTATLGNNEINFNDRDFIIK